MSSARPAMLISATLLVLAVVTVESAGSYNTIISPGVTLPSSNTNIQSWTDQLPLNLDRSREFGIISVSEMRVPDTVKIKVDYMYAGTHIHRLYPDEVDMLVGMFACNGIVLNLEIRDSIPEVAVLGVDGEGNFWTNNGLNGFGNIKNLYFDHAGDPGWHYCLMIHRAAQG